MSSRPSTLLALLALSGCQSSPAPGDAAPPPLTAVATASATIAPAPPRPPLIDLLYRTKARVAVTSNVKNPKDYPEHLIDRRPETAWNSETGDLGARVLFRVPPSARVQRLLLTAGYDKVNKDGDLFFMNHRVTQVEISREGQSLGTFSALVGGNGSLSFLGVIFNAGERANRVRVVAGGSAIDSCQVDCVAMDDFIYAEPQGDPAAVPEPSTFSLLLGGAAMLGFIRRRRCS